MIKCIIKRLIMVIPILLGVFLIVYSIIQLTPGNPGRSMLGADATKTEIDALNHKLGFDKPFFEQHFNFITNLLTEFSLEESWYSNLDVGQEILGRLPISLMLFFFGVLGAAWTGISIGVLSAVKQYSKIDISAVSISIIFASVHVFG